MPFSSAIKEEALVRPKRCCCRDGWWETCAPGAFIFKDVSRDYILKQHDLVFERWDIDAKSLLRKLRMMGRYDSSYGMKQFVEMLVSYVREFWEAIEKDVTV